MPVNINKREKIVEESSAGFVVSFTDENGDALTPSAVTWTLTDTQGTVINSRSAVSVSPASTVTIVLSGNDLQLTSYSLERNLLVDATYSSSLGSNLPFHEEIRFKITPLVAVS